MRLLIVEDDALLADGLARTLRRAGARPGRARGAVEVYVSRLRSKLESARVRIRTVRGYGYILEPPRES